MSALIFSKKACWSFASQVNTTSFLRRVLSGSDLVDRSSENADRFVITLTSLLTFSLLVGAATACLLSCCHGSGFSLSQLEFVNV